LARRLATAFTEPGAPSGRRWRKVVAADVAHDLTCAILLTVRHPHANCAIPVQKNGGNFGGDDNRAPNLLDGGNQAFGNLPRATDGIRGALDVMRCDEGVNTKAAPLRRQPIVASLRREDRTQSRARADFVECTGGGSGCQRQKRRTERRAK
jgi:hypothetical protein